MNWKGGSHFGPGGSHFGSGGGGGHGSPGGSSGGESFILFIIIHY